MARISKFIVKLCLMLALAMAPLYYVTQLMTPTPGQAQGGGLEQISQNLASKMRTLMSARNPALANSADSPAEQMPGIAGILATAGSAGLPMAAALPAASAAPRDKPDDDPLRPVRECIKPGNVIDEDVQECVRGYREKTW